MTSALSVEVREEKKCVFICVYKFFYMYSFLVVFSKYLRDCCENCKNIGFKSVSFFLFSKSNIINLILLSSFNIFYVIFLTFYLIFFLIRIFGKSKIQLKKIKKVERIEGRNIEKGYYETKILFDPFRWLRNLMMYNKGNYLTNGTKIIYLKKPKPTIIETINKFYMEFFIFFTQELDKKRMLEEINNFKEYKEKLIQNFSKGMVKNYNAITGRVNKEIFVDNDILTKGLSENVKKKVKEDLEMSMEKHPGIMLVVPFNKDKCVILRSNLTHKEDNQFITNRLGVRSEINTVKLTVGEYFSYLKDFQICIFAWEDIEGLIREGMIKSYKISDNQLEELVYSIRKG
jgi:hypothetical protein